MELMPTVFVDVDTLTRNWWSVLLRGAEKRPAQHMEKKSCKFRSTVRTT
jgi:hypothetical protein